MWMINSFEAFTEHIESFIANLALNSAIDLQCLKSLNLCFTISIIWFLIMLCSCVKFGLSPQLRCLTLAVHMQFTIVDDKVKARRREKSLRGGPDTRNIPSIKWGCIKVLQFGNSFVKIGINCLHIWLDNGQVENKWRVVSGCPQSRQFFWIRCNPL